MMVEAICDIGRTMLSYDVDEPRWFTWLRIAGLACIAVLVAWLAYRLV